MTPETRFRLMWLGGLLVQLAVCALFVFGTGCGRKNPTTSTQPDDGPALNPEAPADLAFTDAPEQGTVEADLPVIGEFGWQNFVALNWPSQAGKRGVPDRAKPFGDVSVPVVWGSWKTVDDLFLPGGGKPAEWDSPDCATEMGVTDGAGKLTRHQVANAAREANPRKALGQLSSLTQAGTDPTAEKGRPLIAQNGTFVRYEVRINQTAYDYIRKNEFYLKSKLPQPGQGDFPSGTIHVKAAWMVLTSAEAKDRFYHVQASVLDWNPDGTPKWSEQTVGLIGLHIVHRTPTRKSWVWSTFEHVDNLGGPGGRAGSLCSANPPSQCEDARANAPRPAEIAPGQPLATPVPPPVEVVRCTKIQDELKAVNQKYQSLPRIQNTVWRNYQLVAAQWVKNPDAGAPSTAANRLPPNKVANLTMETYRQTSSCLVCHSGSRLSFSFVFYPQTRAH